MRIRTASVVVGLLLAFASTAGATPAAEYSDTELFDIPLQELVDVSIVSAARSKAQPAREASGSVSVILGDEIRAMGARDLEEVIAAIPSFNVGLDVGSVMGLGFRGLWGHDGRILLMIDGQIMNELAYGNTQFNYNYPVQSIHKIEIIRGPGSVNYGGFAALGVINIISKKAPPDAKGTVTVSQATTHSGRSRTFGQANYGALFPNGEMTIATSAYQGVRSNRPYSDFYGGTLDLQDSSGLEGRHTNWGARYGDITARYIHNKSKVQGRDYYSQIGPAAGPIAFKNDRFELSYNKEINDKLKATLSYNYMRDAPWNSDSQERRSFETANPETYAAIYYGSRIERHSVSGLLSYDYSDKTNLFLGVTSFIDRAWGKTLNYSPVPSYNPHDIAVYAQILHDFDYAKLTAGTRYEYNSAFNSKLVSRIGVTKTFDPWHAKLFYSESFRAPQYESVIGFYDPSGKQSSIRPESTSVWDLELGRVLTPQLSGTLNLFSIDTRHTITYFYDAIKGDAYGNLGDTGSIGLDGQFVYQGSLGLIQCGYSYYQARNKNKFFSILDDEGNSISPHANLGFSPHRFTVRGTSSLTDKIRWTSLLTWTGRAYGYTKLAADGATAHAESLNPIPNLSSNVLFTQLLVPWFDLQLGVRNILNSNIRYVQPYNGMHPPIPGLSTEWYGTATIRF